jgi:hypothetical protein
VISTPAGGRLLKKGRSLTFLARETIKPSRGRFSCINPNISLMIKTTTLDNMSLGIDSEDLLRYAGEEHTDEPRKHVIDSLLRYSKSLEIRPSSMIGSIESVTN